MADRIHRLTTDSLSLSSKGETAHIYNLTLFPYASVGDSLLRAEKMELYNLHFPSIVLDGANLHQAFFNQVLFIENFEIEKPVLNFQNMENGRRNKIMNKACKVSFTPCFLTFFSGYKSKTWE